MEQLFELAKNLENKQKEANDVNIGFLPFDDVAKLVAQGSAINELVNHIASMKLKK